MNFRLSLTLPMLAVGLLATSTVVLAQSASPYPMPPAPSANGSQSGDGTAVPQHHRGKMMAALRSLDLSDAQKAQIKDAMTSYRSSRESATPMTRKELRQKIESTLTSAQLTQFKSQMAQKQLPPTPAPPAN